VELSVHEAAERLGVSEATIRRRIRRGDLRAIKHTLPSGYEWRVLLSDHPAVTASDQGVTLTADSAVMNDYLVHPHHTTPQRTDDQPPVTLSDQGIVTTADSAVTVDQPAVTPPDVMRLVERLYTENVQLAGRIGWLESQLLQAQEQVRLLTDSQHTPEHAAPDAEPTPQAADQPGKRVPWWRRLFGPI
jgi:excisionase family DNA binding protein